MRSRALFHALLAATAATGCSSAASMGGESRSDASGGWGGASGAGGMVVNIDAAGVKSDGSTPISLSGDAPTFNWDTLGCNGCQSGGADGGTAAGSGGTSGTGTGAGGSAAGGVGGAISGSGGRSGLGGMLGSGGMTGTTGTGGRTSVGGSTGGGGRADAGIPTGDASVSDVPPAAVDGGGAPDTVGARDTFARADTAGDLRGPDTAPRCVTQIRSVIPMTDDLSRVLVAGKGKQVVLRAEILVGGSGMSEWTWQGSWQGDGGSGPVSKTLRPEDPAAAAFPIANPGTYTFTASDGRGCAATLTVPVAGPCTGCDQTVIIRSVPPPDVLIPVQIGAWTFTGAAPFLLDFQLHSGKEVSISPRVGSSLIQAYVRINTTAGELVADGLADPKVAFGAVLRTMDGATRLNYDVLVVPLDGPSGDSIAATAPQLYPNVAPDNMIDFPLGGGVTVTGKTTGLPSDGGPATPVSDARVMLTNRNPTANDSGADLIFSSVGRADAQGNFELRAQPGQYWISVSPPAGSGMAEAVSPQPITLSGNANVSFQWNLIGMAPLVLDVRNANNEVVSGAHVRLTSAETTTVGTLTVGGSAQQAIGNVRTEAITDDNNGRATFASVPAGATYNVLIAPPALGPHAATTLTTISVPAGGLSQQVNLVPQRAIVGKLEPGEGVAAPSTWSLVSLVAYDRSADSPEPPQTIVANADGGFAIGVSPGRPYAVMVVPDPSTGLARTFVGPGLLQATAFELTQRVPGARSCSGRVSSESNLGLDGTALQVFCEASWPGCTDPTIPLAETTAGFDGAYQLSLPDPSKR